MGYLVESHQGLPDMAWARYTSQITTKTSKSHIQTYLANIQNFETMSGASKYTAGSFLG